MPVDPQGLDDDDLDLPVEVMPDSEAESRFTSLIDAIQYIARYSDQRGRLTDLITAFSDSLKAPQGKPEVKKAPSYAAAATSAPRQPSKPKTATSAPTAKTQIRNAITRFERVSRELPGAPKSTLLNIVAKSNLKNAPPR